MSLTSGLVWCGTMAPAFTPASLQLTGLLTNNYTGSPWLGVASASGGSSGSHHFSDGSLAPAASSGAANFNGSTHELTGVGTLDDYINNNLGSFAILFKSDIAGPSDPGSEATRYQGRAIFSDGSAGYLHLGHNASGVYLSVYSGSYRSVLATATATNWTLLQARISGTAPNVKIEVRANGGEWVSQSGLGNIGSVAGGVKLGTGFGAFRFDGLIREFVSADYALTDNNFDSIRAYVNAKYGLSV